MPVPIPTDTIRINPAPGTRIFPFKKPATLVTVFPPAYCSFYYPGTKKRRVRMTSA